MSRKYAKVNKASEIDFYTPSEIPFGLTFGQWTVKWWQWVFSSPGIKNPILDNDGRHAGVNQSGPVWFLGGTFGENRIPDRTTTIPYGKAILFPVINYEMNSLEDPNMRDEKQLLDHVCRDVDDIVITETLIDGVKIPACRIKSDPPTFDLLMMPNNCLRIAPGRTMAAADGYWVFLKPLLPGMHEIYFHGACSAGTRNATAFYHLTISEPLDFDDLRENQ